ncbi:MAG: acetylglutamate kinase [Terriglobia bacterium]
MKLVVKIGGDAIESARARKHIARQLAALRGAGEDLAVVHGGGKRLTQVLRELGIPTEFDGGLRVTSARARDVALMVLAGLINKQWVAEIESQGQAAFGICGGDGGLVQARKLSLNGNSSAPDLGFVGRPSHVDTTVLDMAFERRMVPVVASLALGPRHEYFNVNADAFAAAIALALGADRLIYLTESGGVWDAERRLLGEIRAGEIETLIERGIVQDGMIPKLRACAQVIENGVGEVDIISSSGAQSLKKILQNRGRAGTRVVR